MESNSNREDTRDRLASKASRTLGDVQFDEQKGTVPFLVHRGQFGKEESCRNGPGGFSKLQVFWEQDTRAGECDLLIHPQTAILSQLQTS